MNERKHPDIDSLFELALRAGRIILAGFGATKAEWKIDETPVIKEVDVKINTLVIDSVSKFFPEISVIGEEKSRIVAGSDYTIVVDPMCGTIPFTWDLPISAFCIALVGKGSSLMSVIYDPFMKRLWYATRGQGSSHINSTLQVSKRSEVSQHKKIERAQIPVFNWPGAIYDTTEVINEVKRRKGITMNIASPALLGGLVSSGQIDGMIYPGDSGLELTAIQLLVEEAGGMVTDIRGDKINYSPEGKINGHITSNGLIHEELVEIAACCLQI